MKLDAMKTEKRRDAPMKRVKAIGIAVLALGMLQSASAYSAVIGTLTYRDPSGTVNANETIDVWVTLTLDGLSDSLTYTPGAYPNGFNPAVFPLENDQSVAFARYDSIGLFTFNNCDDTFTDGCNDPGSQYTSSTPASDTWFQFDGTISPGGSKDFNLMQWDPITGGAAPATYRLGTVGLGFTVFGLDGNDNPIQADFYEFSTNCSVNDSCAFTRTVSAVPLPAAAWLFGSALAGLGFVRKYKRRTLLTA